MKSSRKLLRIVAALVFIIALVAIVANWRPLSFTLINLVSAPYDEAFYEKNFDVQNGEIFRVDDDGARYRVLRYFSEDFESAAHIRELIGIEPGWTAFTLQSPEAPSASDYNNLHRQILLGESDFLDNRIEPSTEQAHTGRQSLKALSVAPDGGACCTKASLSTLLLHFTKGDHVWFSAWYYIEEAGEFITIMDLESSFVRGYPGMRIRLHEGYLEVELAKWVPNDVYRQPQGEEILFPTGRWVQVRAHLLLSENEDGIIQLWQDEALVIDRRGQTLPFAEAVYDSLEVGLSVHSSRPETAILYLDDLVISAEEAH